MAISSAIGVRLGGSAFRRQENQEPPGSLNWDIYIYIHICIGILDHRVEKKTEHEMATGMIQGVGIKTPLKPFMGDPSKRGYLGPHRR